MTRTGQSHIGNPATTSGTAINLPALFTSAQPELSGYLSAQCGASVGTCATSTANTASDPYVPSAATQATYQQRLTYGLPTLTLAQAPQEAAPAGGPDASILLAPIYGGSAPAATAIAPNGGLDGKLQTSTINQIIVNTETNALASFYGSALSYWSRIDLDSAAGYFGNVTGTLTMSAGDRLTTPVTIGSTGALYGNGATIAGNVTAAAGSTFGGGSATSVATTTIAGNLTLQAGSIYAVTATKGQASATSVSGTAGISGSTLSVLANGTLAPFTQTKVLTAVAGLNGQFASTSSSPANVNTLLGYDDHAVTITLDRTDVNLGAAAQTPNQAQIGAALTSAARNTTDAAGGSIANAVYANAQLSGAAARASLDSIGGEGVTATQNASFAASHAFIGSIGDEQQAWASGIAGGVAAGTLGVTVGALPGNALGYAPAPPSPFPVPVVQPRLWRVWGGGFGGESDIDGRGAQGSARQNATFAGGLIGLDYQPQANFIIGAAVGGTSADITVPNRATSGSIAGAHGAVYSTYSFASGLYLDSSVAFSGYSNDIRRTAGGVGALGFEAERGTFDSFEVRIRGKSASGSSMAGSA